MYGEMLKRGLKEVTFEILFFKNFLRPSQQQTREAMSESIQRLDQLKVMFVGYAEACVPF